MSVLELLRCLQHVHHTLARGFVGCLSSSGEYTEDILLAKGHFESVK